MRETINKWIVEKNRFQDLENLQQNSLVNRLLNDLHGVEMETHQCVMYAMSGYLLERLPISPSPYQELRDHLAGLKSVREGFNQDVVNICKRFVDEDDCQSSSSIVNDLLIELATEAGVQQMSLTDNLL